MARDSHTMVPEATPGSYYGRPVLKEPTWRWPIPAYLWAGGLAAGTALAGTGAAALGDQVLARRCAVATLAAVGASGALLVEDLGRPGRFHHMLRVAKPTSPMSVGTWLLAAFGASSGLAAAAAVAPERATALLRPAATVGGLGAALMAPGLATYTAVLLADTAVPAWREAGRQLPWLFAGGAAASGGALATLLALGHRRGPPAGAAATAGARRLAVAGAVLELCADRVMHRHLARIATGDPDAPHLAFPYQQRPARALSLSARSATAAGLAALVVAGRRPGPAGRGGRGRSGWPGPAADPGGRPGPTALGAAAVLAGAALERFAVFSAGRLSARHPAYTVGPQRAALRSGLVPRG